MCSRIKVIFKDESAEMKIEVPQGTRLIDIAQEVDLPISFGCGQGVCGSCRIHLLGGEVAPATSDEVDFLETLGAKMDERLACQLTLENEVVIASAV